MHVTNVGGSLTTAVCLSLIAWSVRVLRATKVSNSIVDALKQSNNSTNEQTSSKINTIKQKQRNAERHEPYARLSAIAFWLLVETKPVEYLIVDVSDKNERSELIEEIRRRVKMIKMDLPEVQVLLRNRNAVNGQFMKRYPGVKVPGLRTNLLFVSPHGKHASQAAAQASSLGFSRCATVVGGLVSLIPLLDSDMKSLISEDDVSLSRDAFMTLLESTHLLSSGAAVIIDIRRYDERVYYGTVRGTVHMLVDHIPKALLLGDEDWFRSFRFPKPKPETFVVLLTNCSCRANWARLVFSDSGITNVKTYSVENGFSWAQFSRVTKYEMFEEGVEAPPEKLDLGNSLPFSRAKGEAELRIAGRIAT